MDTQGGTMKKFLSKAASVAGLTAAFIQGGVAEPTVVAGDSCCATVGDCGVDCSQPMHFGSGCCPTDVCSPWYAHRSGAYGEFLYLSPGNSDILYAREQTDPQPPGAGSPTGPLGIVNIDESAGYRFGVTKCRDACSSWYAGFTRWDGASTHSITAIGQNVLDPVLLHPSTLTNGATGQQSNATEWMSFQFIDAGMRRIYSAGPSHAINWSAGMRYGQLNQNLSVNQTISTPTGLTNLSTDIDFYGVGFLAGLDAERQNACTGLLVYAKSSVSMLAGDWRADSRQTNQFGGGVIASRYEDFRLTPVLEGEVGAGWQSESGKVRLTGGFLASGWFNSISTRDYIQSFNEGNYVDMNDTISFSGLVTRLELRR